MAPRKAPSQSLNLLVLAVGGNVSQGILKALSRSPIPCRVIGTDINELQMGLYTVDRGYIAPPAADPSFLDWLAELCRKESIDAILTGCEPVLRVLSCARQQIESRTGTICLVCDAHTWTVCDDKLLTCDWLKSNGFNHPAYAASEDGAGMTALVSSHGFPLLAKPRIGGGSKGILLLEDQSDLEYVNKKTNYLIQEYLEGGEEEYTAGCFCDRFGTLRGSIVLWRDLLAGTTYRAVAGSFPEVRAEAERIARQLRVHGPCNIQLRMTKRGPVCFEINPRFSGTTPIRAALGFNEVDASLRHFLLGEDDIHLPHVEAGVALRYWNELYVPAEVCKNAREQGYIDPIPGATAQIEPYGIK